MVLNKKPLIAVISAVMAGALLSGCEKPAQQRVAAGPTPVDVVKIELTEAVIRTELSGRTNAFRIAEVRPQVTGIVQKRLFEEGAEVQQGQSLYQIDPTLFEADVATARAALLQAEANMALAKADAARSADLVKINAVSQQADDMAQAQYKVAQANVAAAKAALKAANANMSYTQVRSPITGRVSISEVTAGALVTANQAQQLTTVQQLDPIYVDVVQSYDMLAKLKQRLANGELKALPNGEAEIGLILDSGKQYPLKGKLVVQDALVDEATGMVRIRAVFPNPERDLMPGMYVRAVLTEGVQEKAIKLDQRAVMRHSNGKPYCYVVDKDNKVVLRDLQISGVEGTKWLISSGLSVGDVVISEGILKVRPGATVSYGETKKQAAATK
ncbi:MAG: efflux RND transporter periplasmic adaptor subunit [Duodenibacillus sp.]|nr:efflux RND transporter periplasmic adaptor subunit [Duodenibacillus sp.]